MDLATFFGENTSVALAFSGGVDSSYLLYAGLHHGAKVKAYFVKTAFQPAFELRDAQELANQLGASLTVIRGDALTDPRVAENRADRCYHCKKVIFNMIMKQASADGYTMLIDGTNASDEAGDRAGMRALSELSVRSPLRECGLTKDAIRALSKEAGLFTWDKPAYACLATRVPTGRTITGALLSKVEGAEDALFALGFTDFRVRVLDDAARVQLRPEQMPVALEQREAVVNAIKRYFPTVLMDLEGR